MAFQPLLWAYQSQSQAAPPPAIDDHDPPNFAAPHRRIGKLQSAVTSSHGHRWRSGGWIRGRAHLLRGSSGPLRQLRRLELGLPRLGLGLRAHQIPLVHREGNQDNCNVNQLLRRPRPLHRGRGAGHLRACSIEMCGRNLTCAPHFTITVPCMHSSLACA